MALRHRILRGFEAALSLLTLKEGQLAFNKTDRTLRVGDGATKGGLPIQFKQDRYDLAIKDTTGVLDLSVAQIWSIAHNGSRTITIQNEPKSGRSMVVILFINGSTGTITWPSNVTWNGNVIPKLGTVRTTMSLVWTGSGWDGSVSSSY